MTRTGSRPTIGDVASAAGVSVTTVSHAFNGYRDVGHATAQRIRRVAHELGYAPSAAARGLRLRRTWLIGVVLPDVQTSYFHELLQCLEDEAELHGYGLLVLTSRGYAEREQHALGVLRRKQVEGIVFASEQAEPDGLCATLRDIAVPLVLATPSPAPASFPTAIPDPHPGVREALYHLRGLGHRHLLYLAGQEGARSWYSGRRDDAVQEYATAAEGWRRVDTVRGCVTAEHGAAAMRRHLQGGGMATAVLAFSDYVAAGALQVLYAAAKRVPDDYSVVGFDDLLAPWCTPPLTSVAPPKAALGDAAMTLLLEQLAGQPKRSVILPTTLTVRASTGPAPARGDPVGPGRPADREEVRSRPGAAP